MFPGHGQCILTAKRPCSHKTGNGKPRQSPWWRPHTPEAFCFLGQCFAKLCSNLPGAWHCDKLTVQAFVMKCLALHGGTWTAFMTGLFGAGGNPFRAHVATGCCAQYPEAPGHTGPLDCQACLQGLLHAKQARQHHHSNDRQRSSSKASQPHALLLTSSKSGSTRPDHPNHQSLPMPKPAVSQSSRVAPQTLPLCCAQLCQSTADGIHTRSSQTPS